MNRAATLILIVCSSCSLAACSSFSWLSTNPLEGKPDLIDTESLAWFAQKPHLDLSRYPSQERRKSQALREVDFVLSASGGGQRAAALTLGALLELETIPTGLTPSGEPSNALLEIDYISSVSGGGWAVGAYMTARKDHLDGASTAPFSFAGEREKWTKRLRKLKPSFPRGACLIRDLDKLTQLEEGGNLDLSHIFPPTRTDPQLPYTYANATLSDDHSPFIFCPEFMRHYGVKRFWMKGRCESKDKETRYFVDPEDIEEGYDVSRDLRGLDVSLFFSVGLAASSSVPPYKFVTAEVDLDTCKSHRWDTCKNKYRWLHLVDGGVIDNLGYLTALEILNTAPAKGKRRLLVVLDSSAQVLFPLSRIAEPSRARVSIKTALQFGNATYHQFQRFYESMENILGISIILVSPDSLVLEDKEDKLARKIRMVPRDDPSLAGLSSLKSEICNSEECDKFKAYKFVKDTTASYKIEQERQQVLVDIGRLLLRENKKKIEEAMGL